MADKKETKVNPKSETKAEVTTGGKETMDERTCPLCEGTLTKFERVTVSGTTSLWCDKCELEFVQYPDDNEEGVQRTGMHLLLPLDKFSEEEWQDFLFTERNFYGEEIPDRMPSFSSPEEREMIEAEREQVTKEQRAWRERVG